MYDVIVVGSRVAGSSTAMLLAGSGLRGRYPAFEGVDAVYSPRRTILDPLLLEVARRRGRGPRALRRGGAAVRQRPRHRHPPAPQGRPPLTLGCYTYWQDVPLEGGEIYTRQRRPSGPGRPTTA